MNADISTAADHVPHRSLRVRVADDHPVVRAGTITMRERQQDLQVVFEAGQGDEAVAGWRAQRPDGARIDLNMPMPDGFAAVAALCQMAPEQDSPSAAWL